MTNIKTLTVTSEIGAALLSKLLNGIRIQTGFISCGATIPTDALFRFGCLRGITQKSNRVIA